MNTINTSLRLPGAPHEGPNNFPRSFGQLEGDHRLDLLLLPFLLSREERKSGNGGEAPAKAPTNLLHLLGALHEGQNNPLRPFGQLDGNHRLDLLFLPFLLSREEKEVGARRQSPRESPNEPPAPTKRTP